MSEISDFHDIWDNGLATSVAMSNKEIDDFKKATGAQRVVAREWIFRGNLVRTRNAVRLLPTGDGFVHYEGDDPRSRRLVVLNCDGTRRVLIGVPRIDEKSQPENGYLGLPPSAARFGGIEGGCEGNDGHMDYLFEFDWNTGALLRYARPSRPW